jgi:drug/metabolite transporter (DMT)-like permease
MPWLLLTFSCIVLWGITDILLKKSLDHTDPLSQFKTFIWIGLVMALAGVITAICSDTLPDSIRMVGDNLYLISLCVFYVIALFFGLLGTKHLEASVVSPLENIDGAIAAVILYIFFLFTDSTHLTDKVGVVDVIGTVTIVVGVVFLGIQEHKLSKKEADLDTNQKKHRLGALALIFPIVYNLVDAVSMVAMGITVSGETEVSIPDIDFFFFECVGFAVATVFVWLYMMIAKKYIYNPFKRTELSRCGAGVGDTLGTMAFTFAVGLNPILTAPITSSYCLVTIILARVLLKERLTKKQYLSLAFLVIGIALLSVSEIFNV